MAEIRTNQINVFVFGREQTAIPGAKVVAYDGEEGIAGAIMGESAVAPARITLSQDYESVKLVAFVEGHGSKEATVNADVGNYYFEFEDVGPSETGGSMSTQTRASWIFGSLFVVFVLGVFLFGSATLPDYKQRILAYVCALLAGLFALFFTGSLLLKAELPIVGKWAVQGGAGFALFLIVLFWWSGTLAPVRPAKPDATPNVSASCSPDLITTAQTSQCSATVTGNGNPSQVVTWSATGGSILSSGLFTPSGPGTPAVTATSQQDPNGHGSTTLTVRFEPPDRAPDAEGVLKPIEAQRLCAALTHYAELQDHKAIVVNDKGHIATAPPTENAIDAIYVATKKCQQYAANEHPETCVLVFVDGKKIGNWTLPTEVSSQDSQCSQEISSYPR